MLDSETSYHRGESHLYAELQAFPLRLQELRDVQEESYYTLALSSKPYERERVSRGSKFCGASPVERIVVRILSHPYILELQALVAAIEFLYNECNGEDKTLLLAFWRGEPCYVPPRLLYRYQSIKEVQRVSTTIIERIEESRRTPPQTQAA